MNQYRPEVEPGSFSLMEFAVACPAEPPAQEVIGVVISVDKLNAFGQNQQAYMDGEPRLHIEIARPDSSGQAQYKWDGAEFKVNPFRILLYYDLYWFGMQPPNNPMPGSNPSCYNHSDLLSGAPPWQSVLILGGPGGKNLACTGL